MKTLFQKPARILALLACALLLFTALPPAAGASSSGASAPEAENSASGGEESPSSADGEPPQAIAWGAGDGIYSPPFEIQAAGACLIFEDSGLVVYEKNADEQLSTASTAKLMTAILTAEMVEDLDGTTITVDHGWVFDFLYGKGASHADIRRGETLSIRELLYALLLPSGNEAALILADYLSGGHIENYLFMLQNRARKIGCTNTYYDDVCGLSRETKTTPRDLCMILREVKSIPVLAEIAGTASYEMAAHEKHDAPYMLYNTNRLLSPTSIYYGDFPGIAGVVKGGKTGSFAEWQNYASWAETEDAAYILVVLNSPPEADESGSEKAAGALYEGAKIYNWAFGELVSRPVLDTERPITEIPVRYTTDVDALKLYPSADLQTVLKADAEDDDILMDFDLPEYVTAPVQAGDVVGTLTLTLEGRVIGTADLLAGQDVARNNTLYTVRKGEEFLSGYLKYIIIGAVCIAAIYVAVAATLYSRRQKKKRNAQRRPPHE